MDIIQWVVSKENTIVRPRVTLQRVVSWKSTSVGGVLWVHFSMGGVLGGHYSMGGVLGGHYSMGGVVSDTVVSPSGTLQRVFS